MASEALTEAIEELRSAVAPELQPVIEAILAVDPDETRIEGAWELSLEEALDEG